VFWTSDDGDLQYGLKMAPTDHGDAVLMALESGETYRIRLCAARCREGVAWPSSIEYLGLRCQVCAGLQFHSRGRYIARFERALFAPFLEGHRTVVPFPRRPWDPRAVSDPRLVAQELFQVEEAR
jgi:hypothetical protein